MTVYRFDSDESSWKRLGQSIYGDKAYDYFGWSINLSYDGSTIAIGSPGYWLNEDRPGYVRVFSLAIGDDIYTGTWNQIGRDILGEADGVEFGISVSLSADGKTFAVGAWYNDGNGRVESGHVRVYQMSDSISGWMQLGDDIDGQAAMDNAGYAVSLSADGSKVAIGSPWNSDSGINSGHVRVFVME